MSKETLENRDKNFFGHLLNMSDDLYEDLKLYRARNQITKNTHYAHEKRDNDFIRIKMKEFREKYNRKMGDLEFYLIKAALEHDCEYRNMVRS